MKYCSSGSQSNKRWMRRWQIQPAHQPFDFVSTAADLNEGGFFPGRAAPIHQRYRSIGCKVDRSWLLVTMVGGNSVRTIWLRFFTAYDIYISLQECRSRKFHEWDSIRLLAGNRWMDHISFCPSGGGWTTMILQSVDSVLSLIILFSWPASSEQRQWPVSTPTAAGLPYLWPPTTIT